MNYRIALLTHGPDAIAHDALRSFLDRLTPQPCDVLVWGDGKKSAWPIEHVVALCHGRNVPCSVVCAVEQRGFCHATRSLWKEASTRTRADDPLRLPGHVLWLEHDFRLLRDLDLTPLGAVLASHAIYGDDQVCQMSLMRGPVNEAEHEAGSLYARSPQDFYDEGRWLSHRSYFTTNPSLMSVEFMLKEPWPTDDEPHCEGRYGIELFSKGYRAGVWGGGERWVDHIGARTGFGY